MFRRREGAEMSELQKYRGTLYKVNNEITRLILKNVDEETGEIADSVMEELTALDLTKDQLTNDIALSYFDYAAFVNHSENDPIIIEAKRKLDLAKNYKRTVESLKNILTKIVPEGVTIETPDYKISWRKSEAVETSEFLDLSKIAVGYPDLIEIEYKLKKAEVKKRIKDNLPIPEGIFIMKKQNLQIK